MPSSKRQKAGTRGPQPMRSRTTRSSKARLLTDPTENTQQLTQQLRALGLYAADTLGDGNCLFRALSDQLYGTPSYHSRLRQEICDWIAAHQSRYEPFVEDERGFDAHLKCMRQQGTYGGHLELSAFAHYARRDVKVIQPGLVYVIEWFAGWDPSEIAATSAPSFEVSSSPVDSREKRRMKRDKVRADQEKIEHPHIDTSAPHRPIYVAYHDWEHFSSIRNLKGPHSGVPNVVERSGDSGPPSPVPQKGKQKAAPKQSSTPTKRKNRKSASKPVKIAATSPTPPPPAAAEVPLPLSRSPSPVDSSETPSSSLTTPPPYPTMPGIASLLEPRPYRSPKRTFDESSASSHSETSETASKRARSVNPSRLSQDVVPPEKPQEDDSDADADVDMAEPDADTPALSPSGFSSESSLSPLSSPSPSPPPEKPLTKRQRKVLGLPRQRAHVVGGKGASAGKITIPGGKFKGKKVGQKTIKEEPDDEADAEWAKNGTGRVDVRGFRELKI